MRFDKFGYGTFMGKLQRRIWYGLHLISSGGKDISRFIKKIDQNWHYPSWSMKAVLYPYKPPSAKSSVSLRQFGYQLISDLKKQGFILKRKRTLLLTKAGRKHFEKITEDIKRIIPKRNYAQQPGKDLVIVSFDIPEKQRGKRDWLRSVLINLGLKFYHQSLWMGYIIIPEEFLHDLTRIEIDQYVAIFTVGKQGTLKKIF